MFLHRESGRFREAGKLIDMRLFGSKASKQTKKCY